MAHQDQKRYVELINRQVGQNWTPMVGQFSMPVDNLVPDAALKGFIQHCACTLGAEFYQTPRDAVKGFVGLLSVLEQNPGTDWQLLLSGMTLERSVDPDSLPILDEESSTAASGGQDELATFRL